MNILKKLKCVEWDPIFKSVHVDSAWNHFKSIFNNVLDSVAPIKKVRLRVHVQSSANNKQTGNYQSLIQSKHTWTVSRTEL